MMKSTNTLLLLGTLTTLSVAGCDNQNAAPEATTQVEASKDSEQVAVSYRNAGDLAVKLSQCGDNHCAYTMGACLQATQECGDGEDCQAAYANCSEQWIAPACEASAKVELPAALSCWNTFRGCLSDSGDAEACVGDLYACAQEGCGEEGCEEISFADNNEWPELDQEQEVQVCGSVDLSRFGRRGRRFPGGGFPGGGFPGAKKFPGGGFPGKGFPGGGFPGAKKFPKFPGGSLPGKGFPKFPKFPGGSLPGKGFPKNKFPGGGFPGKGFPGAKKFPGGGFPGGGFPGGGFPRRGR